MAATLQPQQSATKQLVWPKMKIAWNSFLEKRFCFEFGPDDVAEVVGLLT
jgi:hypothetical protein